MTLLEAVQTVLEKADFQDEGPYGEGWPSVELEAARDFLYKWVEQQEREARDQ
jgi:hypothetical protein